MLTLEQQIIQLYAPDSTLLDLALEDQKQEEALTSPNELIRKRIKYLLTTS